ncbi:hypothetical protein ABZ260_33510 [Streptosporangium sp. NPDC006013]|uniref:hypothetical protein n=1 Tax=Streptosporangium sp. NPDC006013 TaxID=3155596 RepID=UPI0033A41EAA
MAEHAARMDLPTEEDRRRERARILDIAQTLLADGLTIRQADVPRVPWSWLG